jgi:hypothetical protein
LPSTSGTYAPSTTYAQATPPSTFAAPNAYAPPSSYTPPNSYIPPPSLAPGLGQTAPAGVGATQAPAGWDPYAVPGTQQPTLLPQDPYLQTSPVPYPGGAVATMTKFLQAIHLDYVWIPGSARKELGVQDADIGATFAIPFLYNTQTPLLITPGFTTHLWNGPITEAPTFQDLPPRTYDAYLDVAWNPQPTPVFGAELGFRVGVYSDFTKIVEDSLRFQGHGLAVLSFSPSVQVKAGVVYLDRNHIKILPAGGLVWTPNPDVRFEILFPNPKISRRLWTYSNTDWWVYVRGEYGGGNWAVKRSQILESTPDADLAGTLDRVDYNDIRVGVGMEFDTPKSWKGLFEVGGAFDREVVYRSRTPTFRPTPTVYVRAGLSF